MNFSLNKSTNCPTSGVGQKKYGVIRLFTYVLTIAIFVVFGSSIFPIVLNADVEELQTKIENRNTQIEQLEEEIAKYQKQLESTGKEKQSLQTTLANLAISNKKLTAEIKLTQNKITSTNLHLEELAIGIEDKSKKLERNRQTIAESVKNANALEETSLVEALLTYKTLSELWNTLDSMEQFENRIKTESDTVRKLKAELENTKTQVETAKKKLVALKGELADRQKILADNQKKTNNLLVSTKNKESNYKKILSDKIALRDAFEQELLQFESQLKFELDPSKLPAVGSGALSWPLDNVKITQYFGNTAFAKANSALYNGMGHNGIDLRASVGTPIKAAAGGIVIGVGNTDTVCPGASYGKWALIKHGNGLSTLYAHFSLIKVSERQEVERGDIIGYSGDTGYATGPHLHFTVYASQAVEVKERKSRVCAGTYKMPISGLNGYLNPLNYL